MALFGFYRCELCKEELFEEKYFCEKCMEELEAYLLMDRLEEEGYYVYSLFFYEGIIKDLIRRWKFHGASYLVHPLTELLCRFIRENDLFVEAFSYIPMHKKKKFIRGFDPMEDLSRNLAMAMNKEHLRTLERVRKTRPLYPMKPEERKRELRGCFNAIAGGEARRLALVDDIYTSGATTGEAARSLFSGHYQEFYFLILGK
jgi:ComF family protein